MFRILLELFRVPSKVGWLLAIQLGSKEPIFFFVFSLARNINLAPSRKRTKQVKALPKTCTSKPSFEEQQEPKTDNSEERES